MSTTKDLTEKVALVTGGSRGIGRAIALALAGAGANVMISYRSSSAEAQGVVDAIKSMGCDAAAYQSDAAEFNQSKEIVDKILEAS